MKLTRVEVRTIYHLACDEIVTKSKYSALVHRRPGYRYRVTHWADSANKLSDEGHWDVESFKGHYWQHCDPAGKTYKRVMAALRPEILAKNQG